MAEKDMKEQENNSPANNFDIDINTDENLSGTTHLNEPVGEEGELEKAKSELEEIKDKFIRKVAEFDNFKRRNAKERLELMQTAGRDVITDMLDVLDDCDRAQKQLDNSDNPEAIKEGVMLVFNKLRNTMQSKGVKAMETISQEFNPDLHDAVTEITAPTEELKGKVVDEVMKGYYLNDKIIRHAKVVVGK
jgi:molecular chaperone GrpE